MFKDSSFLVFCFKPISQFSFLVLFCPWPRFGSSWKGVGVEKFSSFDSGPRDFTWWRIYVRRRCINRIRRWLIRVRGGVFWENLLNFWFNFVLKKPFLFLFCVCCRWRARSGAAQNLDMNNSGVLGSESKCEILNPCVGQMVFSFQVSDFLSLVLLHGSNG